MTLSKVLFSSDSQEYKTPRDLFDKLNKEFRFELDVATTEDNPLHTKYFYTMADDGLSKPWDKDANVL